LAQFVSEAKDFFKIVDQWHLSADYQRLLTVELEHIIGK